MNKKISLMMALIMLFNFIMPSIWHRTFAADYMYQVPGAVGTNEEIIIRDYYDVDGWSPDYPYAAFTVAESGVYQIGCSHDSKKIDYEILDSSYTPLAVAGYKEGSDIPPECNFTSQTVSVYLEAGKTYYVPMYDDVDFYGENNSAFKIKLRKLGDTPYEFELSSSEYTNRNSRSASFRPGGQGTIDRTKISYSAGSPTYTKDQFETPSGATLEDKLSTKQVNILEKVVTLFFVYGVCEQLRLIINGCFGQVTIDDILFNTYNSTKLAFYKENGKGGTNGNPFLESSGGSKSVLDVVNDYYIFFRGIALLFYLILLLYIGVRILSKSTAKDKDKYKTMLTDWVKGVIILFFFPLVIKYSILINEALVRISKDVTTEIYSGGSMSSPSSFMPSTATSEEMAALGIMVDNTADNNIMLKFKKYALDTGSLGMAFIYFYLILCILSFLLIYFKRLITILFLIVLFPFVTISYALDKIKDGKAQIFNNWFKEFILNVFMQLFHAISYIIVTTIISAVMGSGEPNIILVVIGLGYVKKSDELLKLLFPSVMRGGGAGTVKPASQVMQTAQTIGTINAIKGQAQGIGKRFGNARKSISNARDTGYELRSRNNQRRIAQDETKRQEKEVRDADYAMYIGGTEDIGKGVEGLAERMAKKPKNVNPPDPNAAPPKNPPDQNDSKPKVSASQAQKDTAMNAVNKMAKVYVQPGGAQLVKNKIEASGLTPEQKKMFMQMVQEQAKAQEAVGQVLTGKTKDGKPLSKLQLSLQVKVLHDIINSPEAELSGTTAFMIKQQLATSYTNVDKTRYFGPGGQGKRGEFLDDDEGTAKEHYLRAIAKADTLSDEKDASGKSDRDRFMARFSTETTKKRMTALDYVEQEMGKGNVLDEEELEHTSRAQALIGNTSGARVGVMGADGKVTDELVPSIGADGETDLEASRAKKVSREGLKLGEMSSKEKKKFLDNRISDVEDIVEQFVPPQTDRGRKKKTEEYEAERARMAEAAQSMILLQEYERRRQSTDAREHIDGIAPEEMLKITSRLNELSKQDDNVRNMLQQTLGTGKKNADGTVEQPAGVTLSTSGRTLSVDLGVSLDALEAASATAVLSRPTDEQDETSRASIKMAAQSMRRISQESEDGAALAFINRSEHDDILSASKLDDVVNEYGFNKEEVKTQEQIIEEKFVEEKVNLRIKLSDGAMSALRTQMITDSLRAAGATVSATAGTITATSVGIAGTAMVAGASSETSGRNLATTYATTSGIESLAEKLIPGGYGARDNSLGNAVVNAVDKRAQERLHSNPIERNSAEGKQMVDNALAGARAQTIRDRLQK